jgi:hypothetical protein
VAVHARESVLPQEFPQPRKIHERQAAQIQDDVADAVGLRFEAIQNFSDFRDGDKVKFPAKRDERRAAMDASFNGELVVGELLGERPFNGFG